MPRVTPPLSHPTLSRHFAADVKRAEELERRIRFLESQLAARRFRLNKGEAVDVEMNELTTLELLEARVRDTTPPSASVCACFHVFCLFLQLEEEEHALREAMSGFEGLRQSRDELQELMAVLTTADEMLSMSKSEAAKQPLISGGAGGGGSGAAAAAASAAAKRADKKKRGKGYAEESLDQPLLAADAAAAEEGRGGGPGATLGGGGGSGSLSFVTGVIGERGRLQSLERVLWRATRGNLFFRSGPAAHAEDTHVFVVLFQGETELRLSNLLCAILNCQLQGRRSRARCGRLRGPLARGCTRVPRARWCASSWRERWRRGCRKWEWCWAAPRPGSTR